MYFLIPGIVSQIILEEVYELNLPPAIDLALICPIKQEVHGAIPTSYIGSVDTGIEVSSVLPALQFSFILPANAQVFPTPVGFVDLPLVETVEGEVNTIISSAFEPAILEAAQVNVKTAISAAEISTIETGWVEVWGNKREVAQIGVIEQSSKELQQVLTAYDLQLTTYAVEYLPPFSGYVTGIATPAVELVGVEPGYPPLPLPVGFLGGAAEVSRVEATEAEVNTQIGAAEIISVEATEAEVKTTLTTSEFLTIDVASIELHTTCTANYLSIITVAAQQATKIAIATETGIIESGYVEVSSTIASEEFATIETDWVEAQGNILEVREIGIVEQSDRESNPLPSAVELLPSPYAAVSLIIKP